jgi:septin family protein
MVVGKWNHFFLYREKFLFSFQGESGLGKATLINSLFLTDLYPERHALTAQGNQNSSSFFSFSYYYFDLNRKSSSIN